MRFIWNDKTFFERLKNETKIIIKIFIPIFILNFILWLLFLFHEVNLLNLIILSFLSAGTIFTFINIFFQFPSANIPDSYSKWGKTFMYIAHFFLVSIGLYTAISNFL